MLMSQICPDREEGPGVMLMRDVLLIFLPLLRTTIEGFILKHLIWS